MKLNKLFIAALAFAAVTITSCINPPTPPIPGGQTGKDTTQVNPTDTTGWVVPADANIPEGTLTVAQAREICAGLDDKAVTAEKYYVKGFVKKLGNKHADGVANYGNGTFYMVDEKGASDDFEAYQVYGLDGNKLVSADQVEVGDYVVVYGPLTNYGGTYETAGQGKAYIYWSSNPKIGEKQDNPNPGDVEAPEATPVTVAEFNAAAVSTEVYYELTGVISGSAAINTTYGNFDLVDATGSVYVYGLTATYLPFSGGKAQNDQSYSRLGLAAGDTVTIRGTRGAYNDKIEVMGAYYVSHKKGNGDSNPGGGDQNPGGGDQNPGTTISGDTLGVTVEDGAVTLTFAIGTDIDVKDSRTFILGETGYTLTLDGSANTSSGTKIVGTGAYPQFRMYKNTTFTVTAPSGQNITSIDIYTEGTVSGKDYSGANLSIVSGGGELSINAADAKISNWVGSANAVCFTNNNQVRINKLVIK